MFPHGPTCVEYPASLKALQYCGFIPPPDHAALLARYIPPPPGIPARIYSHMRMRVGQCSAFLLYGPARLYQTLYPRGPTLTMYPASHTCMGHFEYSAFFYTPS